MDSNLSGKLPITRLFSTLSKNLKTVKSPQPVSPLGSSGGKAA